MKNMKLMRCCQAISFLLFFEVFLSCSQIHVTEEYVDYVNVFIGTGGHGHTYPGATLPHGMVQLSPDTRLFGWDGCSGYYYADSSIIGFSHTHLSGTGIGDYGDILMMPTSGRNEFMVSGSAENPDSGYRSRFSHAEEKAFPGYYKVRLSDYDIIAELTASLRTGFHRYTYPENKAANLIIDMDPTIHGHRHPVTEIRIVNDSTISGMKYTVGWAKNHYVYFYAKFSRPFTYSLYSGDTLIDGDIVKAETAKALLTFIPIPPKTDVLVKVGISSVDCEGAKRNMEADIPGWDFDKTVADARKIWNKELSVIDVKTDDAKQKEIFYTALYHTAISPCIASDIDGRYRTMGHEIVQDTVYTNYTLFSLWDTFRALHPLYTIICPETNQKFIRSLLKKYDESGVLPKWELASNETGTMIGYHAVSVIADAFFKKQRSFDVNKALKACVRSSTYDTTGITAMMPSSIVSRIMPLELKYKNQLGYVPADRCGRSVSQGIEFAYNDWLIAQMAKDLNQQDVADTYAKRGEYWKNYIDPETRLMRGRNMNGSWVTPFDPQAIFNGSCYVEGNAWQWSWFVPQDVPGLIEEMGGKSAFIAKLDSMFSMPSELTGDAGAALDITGMIGQYAHGNEPSHHIPYFYNYVDEAWKAQTLVDSILCTLYHDTPDGISGNEDCGQMSAWYVLNSMGFYSFCPGIPVYEIGRPLFDEVTIYLPDKKIFVIKVHNNSKKNKYIQSVKWNGLPLSEPRFSHQMLVSGGVLEFEMGDEPDKKLF